jgi:hypothetical protein
MRIFDFLALMDVIVTPERTKVHLATWKGEDNPLDVYLAGQFSEWQRWQTKRNFERSLVVALINLPGQNKWLFGGAYSAAGSEWLEMHKSYYYQLTELSTCAEMNGRLVASFERPGRQSYLNAERWNDQILLNEVLPERLRIAEFPGYRAIDLSKEELDIITAQSIESWRAALASVAGIYLISDGKTGKLYVGSATGEGGIWQRWLAYSATGHGGNVELKELMRGEGISRSLYFRFSVLEIADIHESRESIIRRESHWKSVLLSREHGLNSN